MNVILCLIGICALAVSRFSNKKELWHDFDGSAFPFAVYFDGQENGNWGNCVISHEISHFISIRVILHGKCVDLFENRKFLKFFFLKVYQFLRKSKKMENRSEITQNWPFLIKNRTVQTRMEWVSRKFPFHWHQLPACKQYELASKFPNSIPTPP